MKQFLKKELCCGCGACANACRTGAIRMVPDREGFRYPRVDQARCTDCGQCKAVCPMRAGPAADRERSYFGAQAKDEAVRYSSTSGGAFSVLAEYVLRLQGVVYGAGYDRDMKVRHRKVAKLSELEQVKRTKYVQSSMEGIYSSIEKDLREGRWVLYCGTPCQAHALRRFLKKSYDRLVLVDLVCYGVSSPGVWGSYVKYLEHRHKGKMKEFVFRDKRNRDHGHMCSYVVNDTEYVRSIYSDPYCGMCFSNYTLRPSCYKCRYCTVERCSDFTIGDFWGIEHVRADMDDRMGTSLIITHSEKAGMIWEKIKKGMDWFECEKKDVLQPRLLAPVTAAKRRRQFMMLYSILPFSLIIKQIERKVLRRDIT